MLSSDDTSSKPHDYIANNGTQERDSSSTNRLSIILMQKALGIELVLVPTLVVYNYITILLAELNKRHKTLFQAHEKL